MTYRIRPAADVDIPVLVAHREGMFREMGVQCDYAEMAIHYGRWLDDALPLGTYRGWVASPERETTIVAGGGLIVLPWAPGPWAMDPRCAWIVNVYTDPVHRKRGLARRLMNQMHEWCRAQGIERTGLNASTAGRPVYESMGYVVADEPMMRIKL